ncbi:MAG: O-antigen ligase family protein [Bacteroidota bacterium]
MMNFLRTYCKNWTVADFLLVALIIIFPFYNKLMPSLLILLSFTLIVQRKSFAEVKAALLDVSGPAFWCMALFFVHLIGISYSENHIAGWEDLGMKSTLLLLPILLSWVVTRISLRQIIDCFLFGLIATSVALLLFATYRTFALPTTPSYRYFIASDFVYTMHRSYYAMYTSIGVLLAVYRLFIDRKWINFLWAAFLMLITLLSLSKAGLLILLVVLPILLMYLALKLFNWKVLAVSLGTLLLLLAVTFWKSETMRLRLIAMSMAVNKTETINNNSTEGNTVRVIMWSTSMKLIKEQPVVGVGTGDVNDALMQRNIELGNLASAKRNFNSHNQYLNTIVALGIFGFLPLLLLFLTTIKQAVKYKSMYLLLFATVFALNLLFESMFETQAGVVPIVFFILLLSRKLKSS